MMKLMVSVLIFSSFFFTALAPEPSWTETHAQSAWLRNSLGALISETAQDADFMSSVGLTSKVCRSVILDSFVWSLPAGATQAQVAEQQTALGALAL